MRNGVHSKKKIICVLIQFICGIILGYVWFTVYDLYICDKYGIYSNKFDITIDDNKSNNSISPPNITSEELEAKAEFLEGDGIEDQASKPKKEFTKSIPKMGDSIYSGNFETSYKTNDLLLVGVLTSNKFLKSRACTVYNTWAKHIHVSFIYLSYYLITHNIIT